MFLNQMTLKMGFQSLRALSGLLAGNQSYNMYTMGKIQQEIFLVGKNLCYLLGEGYVKSFKELMNETDWEKYGTGNYDKCSDCMAHCSGYEASAVTDVFKNPFKVSYSGHQRPKD